MPSGSKNLEIDRVQLLTAKSNSKDWRNTECNLFLQT